jgi:hypothetical protein
MTRFIASDSELGESDVSNREETTAPVVAAAPGTTATML